MTNENVEMLKALRGEVVEQHHRLCEYKYLFHELELRVDLLAKAATHFFGDLQIMMLDRLILGATALTDPSTSGRGRYENLSLPRAREMLSADKGRYPVAAQPHLDRALGIRGELDSWRNKLIAHRCYRVALREADPGTVNPARLEVFQAAAERYMDHLCVAFGLGPFDISAPSVANELVKFLKYGAAFDELLRKDPVAYYNELEASPFFRA